MYLLSGLVPSREIHLNSLHCKTCSLHHCQRQGFQLHNEYERGNLRDAEHLCRKSFSLKEKLNDGRGIVACNYLFGLIAEKKGNITKAVRLLESVYKEWTNMGLWQAELALFKLNQLRESKER